MLENHYPLALWLIQAYFSLWIFGLIYEIAMKVDYSMNKFLAALHQEVVALWNLNFDIHISNSDQNRDSGQGNGFVESIIYRLPTSLQTIINKFHCIEPSSPFV